MPILVESQGPGYELRPPFSSGIGTFTVNSTEYFRFGENAVVEGALGEKLKSYTGIAMTVLDNDCQMRKAKFYDAKSEKSYGKFSTDIEEVPSGWYVLLGSVGNPAAKWVPGFDKALASLGIPLESADIGYHDVFAAVGMKGCGLGESGKPLCDASKYSKGTSYAHLEVMTTCKVPESFLDLTDGERTVMLNGPRLGAPPNKIEQAAKVKSKAEAMAERKQKIATAKSNYALLVQEQAESQCPGGLLEDGCKDLEWDASELKRQLVHTMKEIEGQELFISKGPSMHAEEAKVQLRERQMKCKKAGGACKPPNPREAACKLKVEAQVKKEKQCKKQKKEKCECDSASAASC
jgi:hypothetical protein